MGSSVRKGVPEQPMKIRLTVAFVARSLSSNRYAAITPPVPRFIPSSRSMVVEGFPDFATEGSFKLRPRL